MSQTNGQRPTNEPPTSPRAAIPPAERIALLLLLLARQDGDDSATARALALLGEHGPAALEIAELAIAVEPRLRTAAARAASLNQLALLDYSYSALTRRSLMEGIADV